MLQLMAADVETVSFPGLGIGDITLNKIAFPLFGRPVRWYGILICIGMILGVIYIMTRAKHEKIETDDVIDLSIFTIIFSVIGARLYFVATTFNDPQFQYVAKGADGKTDFWKTLLNIIAI